MLKEQEWQIPLMQGVEYSHWLLKRHVGAGAVVVDATAGNGYDTLFLARLVGRQGKVFAFDIQKEAIVRTRERLEEAGVCERVRLVLAGHELMEHFVSETPVDGILFNLGYLPGGKKEVITVPETTIPAVKSALELLGAGGLLVVVIYVGHPGGKQERKQLLKLAGGLDAAAYNVLHYRFLNQDRPPPEVLAVKKRYNPEGGEQ